MAIALPKLDEVLTNPVVVRDLRMRLRGTKAYWSQAFYLGLLILLALSGYLTATGFNNHIDDPVAIQRNLQTFYYFIFETLAALITLIAPALTAVAVISEKQRLTFDLVVASPMSAMKMLSGKLISSIAFLLLLLVMSIPASALCVILGGATVGDVLRIYALLAIDGVVLAAIGLAFSCTSKQNVQAIIGTYGAIVGLYIVCLMVYGTTVEAMYGAGMVAGVPTVAGIAAIGMLNPFVAVATPNVAVQVFGESVPLWCATAVAGALFVRIVLTGAALRLGMYGPGLIGSLRRQALAATAFILYLVGSALTQSVPSMDGPTCFESVVGIGSLAFLFGCFFFPTLFVPVTDEEAPAGQAIVGSYSLRAMFRGEHRGALPYYHVLIIVCIAAIALGVGLPASSATGFSMPAHPAAGASDITPVKATVIACGCLLWYLSGIGFFIWSIARRVSSFVETVAAARPVTFLIAAFICVAPMAIMIMIEQASDAYIPWNRMWLRHVFLLYPPLAMVGNLDMPGNSVNWLDFLQAGFLAYILGCLAYPFWKSVTPGYGRRALRQSAAKGAA